MLKPVSVAAATEVELCRALRERIAHIVQDYRLETDRKNEAPRTFRIINGWLPPVKGAGRDKERESEAPFIIVRPSKGKTESHELTRVTVQIVICTHAEAFDGTGHEYAMSAMARIKNDLMRDQILDSRYQLDMPIEWELFEDQPAPFWQLAMTTAWIIPTPQQLQEEEY